MNDSNLFNSTSHTITPNTQDNAVNKDNPDTDTPPLEPEIIPESDNTTSSIDTETIEDTSSEKTSDNKGLDPQKDLGINSTPDEVSSNADTTSPITDNKGLDPQKDLGVNPTPNEVLNNTDTTSSITDNKGLDPQKDLGVKIDTNSQTLGSNTVSDAPISSNPFGIQSDSSTPSPSTTVTDSYSATSTQTPISNSVDINTPNNTSNPFISSSENISAKTSSTNFIETKWNWAAFVYNWIYLATFNLKTGIYYFLIFILGLILIFILGLILNTVSGSLLTGNIITLILEILLFIGFPIYIGIKGESIVLRKGKFQSEEDFRLVQKYFSRFGGVLIISSAIIFVLYMIFLLVALAIGFSKFSPIFQSNKQGVSINPNVSKNLSSGSTNNSQSFVPTSTLK